MKEAVKSQSTSYEVVRLSTSKFPLDTDQL